MFNNKKLLILLSLLVLSIPWIKNVMIYLAIFNLLSANFIKNLLHNFLDYFSISMPNVILIVIAQIFWPFTITVIVDRLIKWRKAKHLLHPVALASGLWIILNGSALLIQ
jgi:hypothetical protein